MGDPVTNVADISLGGHENVQDIVKALSDIRADSFANDGDRIQAVASAYALVSRLETPWEFVLRTCMGQVWHT